MRASACRPRLYPILRRRGRISAEYKASARVTRCRHGEILQSLAEGGLAENTLVIYSTDHGIAFPRMKGNLTDHGMGVLADHARARRLSRRQGCDAMVSHIDIFPTLCDLLAHRASAWLQGKSLLPWSRRGGGDTRGDLRRGQLSRGLRAQTRRPHRRWKYIRHFDHRLGPVLTNCDDSPSKDVLGTVRLAGTLATPGTTLRPRLRPQRGLQHGQRSLHGRRSGGHADPGSTIGCSRPTTPCYVGPSPHRPARS